MCVYNKKKEFYNMIFNFFKKTKQNRFFDAIRDGNIRTVEQLISDPKVDVNAKDKNRMTSMHWAAHTGRLQICKLLIEHGTNVNVECKDLKTPLHMVAICLNKLKDSESRREQLEIAQLLIDNDVDINAKTVNGVLAKDISVDLEQLLLDRFWKWIVENIEGVTNEHVDNMVWYRAASGYLKEFNDNVYFEYLFSSTLPISIIISADGYPDYFNQVLNVCNQAPDDSRFKCIAFRQPRDCKKMGIGGISVQRDNLLFNIIRNVDESSDVIALQVFLVDHGFNFDHASDQDRQTLQNVVFLLLQHNIGEYDFALKIGSMRVLTSSTKPLSELNTMDELMNELNKIEGNVWWE